MELVKCNDDERIAIHDLYFERSCSNCYCVYDVGSSCEQFPQYGSWENNYYYNAVSGKHESVFITHRTHCPNNGTERRIYTNQVNLRYECVTGKYFVTEWANSMTLALRVCVTKHTSFFYKTRNKKYTSFSIFSMLYQDNKSIPLFSVE